MDPVSAGRAQHGPATFLMAVQFMNRLSKIVRQPGGFKSLFTIIKNLGPFRKWVMDLKLAGR